MKINIDGKEIEAQGRKTLLEIARENNIFIPSLCDFKELEPFSGCRMCLVKVKGMKGYVPSCSTYAEEGMKVQTKTPDIIEIRKNILELILTEHPNACLICEEKDECDEHKATIRKVDEITGCVLCPNNGRCELQKVVEQVGLEKMSLPSVYRDFEINREDPFFDRNYNLCILCGRCVRVCREVRGLSVISFIRRGAETTIATSLGKTLLDSGCQFCGACVDVCPTGALTERAIKYDSPPDEKKETVCPLCSIGCNIEFNFFKDKLLGVDVIDSGPVNRGQACVRGRFALRDVVQSDRRIDKPLIRKNNLLEETTWDEAIDYASRKLEKYKPEQMAVMTSPQMSCEDIFVFNKFAKEVLGTNHYPGNGTGSSFSFVSDAMDEHGISFPINNKLDAISDLDMIFLLGGNVMESNPVVWVRILKALTKGADFITTGFMKSAVDRYASNKWRIKPGLEFSFLAFLTKWIVEKRKDKKFSSINGFEELIKSLGSFSWKHLKKETEIGLEEIKKTADMMKHSQKIGFILPPQFFSFPRGRAHAEALLNLVSLTNARIFPLSAEGNDRGQHVINKHFYRNECETHDFLDKIKKGKIKSLFTTAPLSLPEDVDLEFLIVQDSFKGDSMNKADMVLPAAVLPETNGSIVNTEGRIQTMKSPLRRQNQAKPDWQIITEIAQKMGSKDFNYSTVQDIRKEMENDVQTFEPITGLDSKKGKEIFLSEASEHKKGFIPLKPVDGFEKLTKKYPLRLRLESNLDYYRNFSLSEEIPEFEMFRNVEWIKINKKDAEKHGLKEKDSVILESQKGKTSGVVHITESVPEGVVTAYYTPLKNEDRTAWDLMPVKITRGK